MPPVTRSMASRRGGRGRGGVGAGAGAGRGRGGVGAGGRGRGRGRERGGVGAGGRGRGAVGVGGRGRGNSESGAGDDLACSFCRKITLTDCPPDCIYRGIMSPATEDLDEDAIILSRYFKDQDIREHLQARGNFSEAQRNKFLQALLLFSKLLEQWKEGGPSEWIEQTLNGMWQAAEVIRRAGQGGDGGHGHGGGGAGGPGGGGGCGPRGVGGPQEVGAVGAAASIGAALVGIGLDSANAFVVGGGNLAGSSVGSAVGAAVDAASVDGVAPVGADLDSANASVVGGGGNPAVVDSNSVSGTGGSGGSSGSMNGPTDAVLTS